MTTEPDGPAHDPQEARPVPAAGRRVRPAPLVMGIVAGLGVALLAVLAVALFRRADTQQLTRSDYDQAVARWEAHGPANYNLDLELSGNRPGKIHVEVRGGEVVHMTRDGVEPKQERTWYYWSVPGQLDTIGQELEMARDPAESFDSPGATGVVMWAEFDPKLGYPRKYDRVVLGTSFEIHWKVTRFEALEEGKNGEKK